MTYIIAGATGVTGQAIAKELSINNDVHIIGRDEEKLSLLSDEIKAPYSVINLENTLPIKEFQKTFEYDEIKGLVNCIGSIYLRPLHGSSVEDFNSVINVNLFSSYYLLAAFARKMKNGSAVFFSSVAASKGLSNHELISAAKAGIEGMARSAAASYAKDNLRVNVIAPSIMDTNMSAKILSSDTAVDMSKSMHPIPKIGDVNDILPVVRWLLSSESKWVTGQTIHVDGGFSTVKPR
ncbi:MAG: SDR family NAD(P)-dependent oxidoreductase [Candidatus Actinomarinaceae bacterium]